MIFIGKNEKGEPTWKLALEGKKIITRRLKPLPVGKDFAIQPGRGKYAVARAKVISCISSLEHWNKRNMSIRKYKKIETKKEGFYTWKGLRQFFMEKKIWFFNTFRIEFEVIKKY